MVFDGGNCSVVPESTPTNAGVAGAGTLLSFIITNLISLSLSAIIIFCGRRKHKRDDDYEPTLVYVAQKLLQSFSDQQIITGIGIQSIGLAMMRTMVPYHFFIIWLLSLLSTATNLATLLALVNEFKRNWLLLWLRQFFMFVNLILGVLSGVFILQSVMKNLEPRLPIACVWEVGSRGKPSNGGVSVVGTIAVIAGEGVVFGFGTWYLHSKRESAWIKTVQAVGLLILIAMGIGATIRVIMVSQAFGSPPASVRLIGLGEKEWSFGQLLPLLLLILPLISTLELIHVRKLGGRTGQDDKARLLDTELTDSGGEQHK